MILVKPNATIIRGKGINGVGCTGTGWHEFIETCARVCYKSESKITVGSAMKLIKKLIARNHWTPFEFWDVTVRFICDRGISHELVRHRICSFLQESSRYCDYGVGNEAEHVKFVIPFFCQNIEPGVHNETDPKAGRPQSWWADVEDEWWNAMATAEEFYHLLRQRGVSPQGARDVLPNSLKTEVICKANLREWRHIFKLRCNKAAHPDMVSMMRGLLDEFGDNFSPVFDDLVKEYLDECEAE